MFGNGSDFDHMTLDQWRSEANAEYARQHAAAAEHDGTPCPCNGGGYILTPFDVWEICHVHHKGQKHPEEPGFRHKLAFEEEGDTITFDFSDDDESQAQVTHHFGDPNKEDVVEILSREAARETWRVSIVHGFVQVF